MGEVNDAFDKTVWDPEHPEQAIEDPLHGPSAVLGMLQQEPMPMGDGRYYQPGLYSLTGNPYVDSKGRPCGEIIIDLSHTRSMQRARDLHEWLTASQEGEAAKVALETVRQRRRLEENSFAFCFKPTDVCPGGVRLEACETGSALYDQAQEWTDNPRPSNPNRKPVWTTRLDASRKCGQCALHCEVAVRMLDGEPDETRIAFMKPLEYSTVIRTDSQSLQSPLKIDPIQAAKKFYTKDESAGSQDSNDSRLDDVEPEEGFTL